MSDYTKTTNFTAKDSLLTGDPNKLIQGSLFDTEFDNIATAIATKADDGANSNITSLSGLTTPLSVAQGGTGSTTASGARTNLGLGTIATQASSAVSITGGSVSGITDLAVADGGTGASTAADARTNLGLGTIATQSASSVALTGGSITGITDLAIADGGTGASTAADARTNLGINGSGGVIALGDLASTLQSQWVLITSTTTHSGGALTITGLNSYDETIIYFDDLQRAEAGQLSLAFGNGSYATTNIRNGGIDIALNDYLTITTGSFFSESTSGLSVNTSMSGKRYSGYLLIKNHGTMGGASVGMVPSIEYSVGVYSDNANAELGYVRKGTMARIDGITAIDRVSFYEGGTNATNSAVYSVYGRNII